MANKIATLIFIIIQVLILSVSAFLVTIENNTGTMIAGVSGLVLCTISSWVFRVWYTIRTEEKEEADETVSLFFHGYLHNAHKPSFFFVVFYGHAKKTAPFMREKEVNVKFTKHSLMLLPQSGF